MLSILIALSTCGSVVAHEKKQDEKAGSTTPAAQMDHAGHSMVGHSERSKELHAIIMKGKKEPMPMKGDVDKDFAVMMAMHHQQGIEMAEVQLKHGKGQVLKDSAMKIKETQQNELEILVPHSK